MSLVFIKSRITDETKSMDIEGKSVRNAYPGSEQNVCLRKFPNSTKFITGYDLEFGETEEAILKDKKHPKHELMKEKKEIERLLGISLDNDDSNEFLLNMRIPLCVRGVAEIQMNLQDPLQKLQYRALIAGGHVAPSKEALREVKYLNSLYYFSEPKAEESNRKIISKLKNKAGAKLTVHEENKLWLLGVSHMLKLPVGPELSTGILYAQIDDYKNNINKKVDIDKVITAMETSNEELEFNFLVDMGLRYFIIQTNQEKQRTIDGVEVGASLEQLKTNLRSPKYQDQFLFLREKIHQKYNIG